MQYAQNHLQPLTQKLLLHVDGGTNRSLKNYKNILLHFKNIKAYMSSASKTNDIKCTGIGYLPWKAPTGDTILIKCFYSPMAVDTIISPTDIVLNHITEYHSWTHHADMSTGQGHVAFINKNNNTSLIFPLVEQNGLWYSCINDYSDFQPQHSGKNFSV